MADITPLPANKTRKLGETVFTDRGSRLAPRAANKPERWPLYVLVATPFIGLLAAAIWQSLL